MIESIAPDTISRIANHLFGANTQIASFRKIVATREHGITKVAESTRNLLYLVRIQSLPHAFVFRFDRTGGDEVYDREVHNYRLLSNRTGIRVPTVYCVDRSKRLAPTAYMVLEYLTGTPWNYLAHPNNPTTNQDEKVEIRRRVGRYYARVHGVRQDVESPGAETHAVLNGLDRLTRAVRCGVVNIDLGTLDRCRQAAMEEPRFRRKTLSLCLIDAEVHMAKCDAGWDLAFVCDAEWVGFRHPYADLVSGLGGVSPPWWERGRPLFRIDAATVSELPFFRGYEQVKPVDYEKLLHLSPYYELDRWSHLATERASPAKKQWLKGKEPLLQALVQEVAVRA